jgi:guanosine-3',5'-bis(diphosphate) 3'-pyrophosphohydrolase
MADRPLSSVSLVLEASLFAAERHQKQRRKGVDAVPYINHPLGVARVLAVDAGVDDPVTLAAALLHDTIEDTGTTAAEIEAAFGKEVAAIVLEVTDDKSLPSAVRKQLQIDHAGSISRQAQMVKLADKLCNVRDLRRSPPPDWSAERVRGYFHWARRVVDQMRGTCPALDKLLDEELGR